MSGARAWSAACSGALARGPPAGRRTTERAHRDGLRSRGVPPQGDAQGVPEGGGPRGRGSRHRFGGDGGLPGLLRRGGPRGRRGTGRSRHRARWFWSGGAAGGEQGPRGEGRSVQRPVPGGALASAQRRERAGDGWPDRRRGPGERDRPAVADDAVRGRSPRSQAATGRRDRTGRTLMVKDFVADWDSLAATDAEVARAIADEVGRERSTLRLIASENYASPAVLAAQASTMNNKYAE